MNQDTRENIQRSAALIFYLFQNPSQYAAPPPPPYGTAIALLSHLEGGGTVADLSDKMGLHPNTIFEYLNALQEGGIEIEIIPQKREPHRFEDGRPNNFFRLL